MLLLKFTIMHTMLCFYFWIAPFFASLAATSKDQKTLSKGQGLLSAKAPQEGHGKNLIRLLNSLALFPHVIDALVVGYVGKRWVPIPLRATWFSTKVRYAFVGDTVLVVGLNASMERVIRAHYLPDAEEEIPTKTMSKDRSLLAFVAYSEVYILVDQKGIVMKGFDDDDKELLRVDEKFLPNEVHMEPTTFGKDIVYVFSGEKIVLINLACRTSIVKNFKKESTPIVSASLNKNGTLLACAVRNVGVIIYDVECGGDGRLALNEPLVIDDDHYITVMFISNNILVLRPLGRDAWITYGVDGGGKRPRPLSMQIDFEFFQGFPCDVIEDMVVGFVPRGQSSSYADEAVSVKAFSESTNMLVIKPSYPSSSINDPRYVVSPNSNYMLEIERLKCSVNRISATE